MPVPAIDMDSVANGGVESSAEPQAPAPAPEAEEEAVPKSSPAAAATKGRGLRRWRRIRREQQREAYAAGGSGVGGGGADEDSAQLHKRRLPLAADAPKGKHEAALVKEENSTASVESPFVPPALPAKLDPGLGFLIASAGFSFGAGGADSDSSEHRSSKSSTAASAPRVFPRHEHALLFPRERDRLRSRAPGASLHGKNPRAARSRADKARVYAAAASTEAENSRSSVESDLRSSNAMNGRRLDAGVTGNGVHKVLSDYCDHSDEGQPSEEVRLTAGGYYKVNGSSAVGRLVRRSAGSDDGAEDTLDEGDNGKGQNGGMHLCDDPYAESILILQRTQEALENEIEKYLAIGKEPSDDFDVHDDEWTGSVHLEEPTEEVSERIKHPESRLEKASELIKEKDLRIFELKSLGWMQPGKTAIESTNLQLSQSDLDRLYQEKMEAEIQCIILTRTYQTWAPLAEDQMDLYEAQKSLSLDYKQLRLKLQHTENRAMMLEEMAEKLQVQCKELSGSSEILQLQSKASRVSLFCFVQFTLLCIAIGTYLMRLVPSSTEVVPT
ncbi:WPP domain-interacting protein 1-like [Phragmites australis]|uniref:WPP domain-interacting protein 1-like n=1 Tax=Phragmites australis TaxID=29695 RepID=UPI002D78E421|nr:WPP domain-interacting protein 1-like [Phragmites australis]